MPAPEALASRNQEIESLLNSLGLHSIQAGLTDVLAAEGDYVFGIATEDTSRFVLPKDDLVGIDVNLKRVPFCYVKCTTQFNRNYDPS
jgi:hypothetical protein